MGICEALLETPFPHPVSFRVEGVGRYLDNGDVVLDVESVFPRSSGLVASGADDTPDLDVPTVGEEVGPRAPVERQDWFVDVGDAVLIKPVVNPLFVDGAH